MRPSEWGLERETSTFKMAKNYSNGLARPKHVSRIKSGIVGPFNGRGKHICVNRDIKRVCPINGYLHLTEEDTCLHTILSA